MKVSTEQSRVTSKKSHPDFMLTVSSVTLRHSFKCRWKVTECVSVSSGYTKLIIRSEIRTEFLKKSSNAWCTCALSWKKVARTKGRCYEILKHEHVTQVPTAFQNIHLSIFIPILTAQHRSLCRRNSSVPIWNQKELCTMELNGNK
jgi:hypothetical protein